MDYSCLFSRRNCDFCIQDIENVLKDTKNSFLINNRRVWMKQKPDFLKSLDRKLKFELDIDTDIEPVISIYLPVGSVWPVNMGIKKEKFFKSVIISTDGTYDVKGKITLRRMYSNTTTPFDEIFDFKVKGYLIIIDYPGTEQKNEINKALKDLLS